VWKDWGLRYGIVGELLFLSSSKNQRSEIGFENSRIRRAGSISWDLGGAVPARHGTLMLRAALGHAL
jgi:hypothetical protein